MINLFEYRSKDQGLADRLTYAAIIEDGVMLNKDGSLLASWSFRGPDLNSSTNEELGSIASRLNGALRFGSGWMMHCDLIRFSSTGYPKKNFFPDRTTRIIDDERRQQFLAEGSHYDSLYYITLSYLPGHQVDGKMANMVFDENSKMDESMLWKKTLSQFEEQVQQFEDELSSIFVMTRLKGKHEFDEFGRHHVKDDLLRYLRFCVTAENTPMNLPPVPMYMDTLIGSEEFFGGIAPRIGKKHIRVIAIDGFPHESYPSIFSGMDEMAIDYRWSTRFIFMDNMDARTVLKSYHRKWKQKVRGFKDQVMNTSKGVVNTDALEMTADVEEAMSEVESGLVRYGYYNSNIIVYDDNLERIETSVREVRKLIANLGFAARVETINCIEAWLGSLPGHGVENIRRSMLHTMNLSDLIPTTSVWAGPEFQPCPFYPPESPPLLYAATSGATPFRLCLHVGDVGHTLIMGPTGAGKSTLLAFIIAQMFRYPRANVFAFDKGYSLYALTKAAGGTHYDIAGGRTKLSFCPLQFIDDAPDFAWAAEWIEVLCSLQGMAITPALRNDIARGLELLKESPTRTLTEFTANVPSMEVRESLQHYTISGPMGLLLDAETDSLGTENFMTFEMEHLMGMGEKNLVPVLLYLFRRVEKRLKGQPALVPIDEGWLALSHPMFREKIREWLKVMRKANCSILLATQSISDVFNSPIRDVLLESCPTKILLPNPEAKNEASRKMYEVIGLNPRQVEILAVSTPKRHYYYMSPAGRRLFQLGLGGVTLNFVAISNKDDLALIDRMIAEYGNEWPAEWLEYRGYKDWADYWRRVKLVPQPDLLSSINRTEI
jgi:type IV secretion system protein TrbE